MPENQVPEDFTQAVEAALKTILGDSGAKSMLFYIGKPDPQTFETKLRSILGEGAQLVLRELKKRTESNGSSPKRDWSLR